MNIFLIHYGEVGLKGQNRHHFEDRLIKSIYRACRGLGVEAVSRLYGRLRLDVRETASETDIVERLERVPGITHFSPAIVRGLDVDAIEHALLDEFEPGDFETFGVRTKRLNKQFPMSSHDIDVCIGSAIGEKSKARVDLKNPERAFRVLVLNEEIYASHRRYPGMGGLPLGASGKVCTLLSSGIDSPVAAERLLRRGCPMVFVHFHSAPFVDRASVRNATELANRVTEHRIASTIHHVPIGEIQRKIAAEAPDPYRIVLYRRAMMRLASRIAKADGCLAVATGDSIGQVASQTLEHFVVIDAVAELPVLRPLASFDKQQVIDEAKQIGTYEISIRPDEDCCSYLLPREPMTRPRLREVEKHEAAITGGLDLDAALDAVERVDLWAST